MDARCGWHREILPPLSLFLPLSIFLPSLLSDLRHCPALPRCQDVWPWAGASRSRQPGGFCQTIGGRQFCQTIGGRDNMNKMKIARSKRYFLPSRQYFEIGRRLLLYWVGVHMAQHSICIWRKWTPECWTWRSCWRTSRCRWGLEQRWEGCTESRGWTCLK